jgi:hypothetical protein
MLEPQLVEKAQALTSEPAELRMVAFRLELGDDDDRQYDVVLVESGNRRRIGEKDTGVENKCAS